MNRFAIELPFALPFLDSFNQLDQNSKPELTVARSPTAFHPVPSHGFAIDPTSMTLPSAGRPQTSKTSANRPPGWLVLATGALAVTCLVLAIAETNLWAHYLIDGGEYLSLCGVGFILIAGLFLFRTGRLKASLPLVVPWLMYPVITQGDEIIDNLSINPMRIICLVLLSAIFAAPVSAVVYAARLLAAPKGDEARRIPTLLAWVPGLRWIADGRTREGAGLLTAALLTLEIPVAHVFLGVLMVGAVVFMILAALVWVSLGNPDAHQEDRAGWMEGTRGERFALGCLLVGVVTSLGIYVGYKNRPEVYQGSPAVFMDPKRKGEAYSMSRIPVPNQPVAAPARPDEVRVALDFYGNVLEKLLGGFSVLDRNYTWDYHNHLFLKNTPLVPQYRTVGLQRIAEARALWTEGTAAALAARATLPLTDPLAALMTELHAYATYHLARTAEMERLSLGYEKTQAGLQHAAHLYEGECKELGSGLDAILKKHAAVLAAPQVAAVTAGFSQAAHRVGDAYAKHIVGF